MSSDKNVISVYKKGNFECSLGSLMNNIIRNTNELLKYPIFSTYYFNKKVEVID